MDVGHVAKSFMRGMPTLLTGGVPGERAGDERLAFNRIMASELIGVESPVFGSNEAIPFKYSAEGENISPPLRWSGVPGGAMSIAIIVEDPDAPTPKPFVHWLAYNIDPQTKALPEGSSGKEAKAFSPISLEGKNSMLRRGYTGAAPPKGDLPHHYHYCIFALDQMLDLDDNAGRNALLQAMEGHVIAKGRLIGTFRR